MGSDFNEANQFIAIAGLRTCDANITVLELK